MKTLSFARLFTSIMFTVGPNQHWILKTCVLRVWRQVSALRMVAKFHSGTFTNIFMYPWKMCDFGSRGIENEHFWNYSILKFYLSVYVVRWTTPEWNILCYNLGQYDTSSVLLTTSLDRFHPPTPLNLKLLLLIQIQSTTNIHVCLLFTCITTLRDWLNVLKKHKTLIWFAVFYKISVK